MLPGLLLALLVLPAAAGAQGSGSAWRSDVPCHQDGTARRLAVPESEGDFPGPMPPCPRRSCVALPGGGQVCACAGTEGPDSIRVERPGAPAREWTLPAVGLAAGAGWEVVEVEMDGVAPREVAVAVRTSLGMGLGVSRWRIWVVPGTPGRGEPPAVRVQEYGFWGSWARPRDGGPCRLLATRWTRGTEPGRGEGLYVEGEWLRLRGSRLQRDPTRPVVERRYLLSFQRDRIAEGRHGPLHWLRHPSARARRTPRAEAFPLEEPEQSPSS